MGDQGYTYTLDEAISTIGFGNFQLIVLAYAGLGWVAEEAMEMMLLSYAGPAIQPEWGLFSSEESLISTVAFFDDSQLSNCSIWVLCFWSSNPNVALQAKKTWELSTLNKIVQLTEEGSDHTISCRCPHCPNSFGHSLVLQFVMWFIHDLPYNKVEKKRFQHGSCALTKKFYTILNRKDDKSTAVIIGNPYSTEFEAVRRSLMAGILKTVSHNKDSCTIKDIRKNLKSDRLLSTEALGAFLPIQLQLFIAPVWPITVKKT
ncbi:General substrate transporter [Artemisia annua]|uniref:General substrate transporter n=1 Tax=Artemisia annua TaxID=35608 RepID=A0A2U1P1G9_ARTAN|nr:General substrate transporter [Artemisia annua]